MMIGVVDGDAYRRSGLRRLGATVVAFAVGVSSLALAGNNARAEPLTAILIPASQPGPEGDASLERALAAGLSDTDIALVDGFALAKAALLGGAVLENELAPFLQAEELLEEGWRSYLEVRASFAAARLAEARTLALAVAHHEGGRALVAEISLRLGVVKLDLARNAEAADDFRLSHILAPHRAVTEAEFKPEAVGAYNAALASPSAVHARTIPARAGLRLWIDGSEVFGESVRLSEGLHMLEAKEPGSVSRSKLLSISPGDASPIRLTMEPDPTAKTVLLGRAGFSIGRTESQAREAATAMLLYSQTNQLLAIASVWRRGSPALLGQRCSGMPAHCSSVVEIGYPAGGARVAVAELWRAVQKARLRFPPTLQADARIVSAEPAPGTKGKSESTPLWKNQWLWLGAAAAAVAGSAVYLLAEPDVGKSVFVGDPCDFGGC
tara:strand:+ start:9883 stop:11199 length:1317 start_codon:yes stop_codon:yes gene_type:complete